MPSAPASRRLVSAKRRLDELQEYAWLNLAEDHPDLELVNPLEPRTQWDRENPHLHLLRILRDPDYFPFTCKHVCNIELFPFQHVLLKELWGCPFPMLVGSRGMGKSFGLALYCILRALFLQGRKIVICGASFRQAKVVFEYCEGIWANAPVLRDLVGSGKGRNNRDNGPRRDIDRCELIIGDSIIMALPLGDGKKIRGQRAHDIIADEFASIPPEIYENVVAGFAAVSASPVDNAKAMARERFLRTRGLWTEAHEAVKQKQAGLGNQAILSGTAYYEFNWFGKYWRRYKAFIESRGDRKKLAELFGGEENVQPSFSHRDYKVIRMPVQLLPEGFMDEKHVARSKATVHAGIYQMEFGAVFTTDSEGFFRRSLVESCVAGRPQEPLLLPSGPVTFTPALCGEKGVEHVIGIDPAAVSDNFSIVVLALHPDHRRVVYVWTTTRQSHRDKVKAGLVRQHDFYGFCARKIRDLMKAFRTRRLIMDGQGGGVAVEEALRDPDKLEAGESPILQVVDVDDPKDSDGLPGEHVLEIVQFARADWVGQANHGLRKDFEDKAALFPYLDPAFVGLSIEEDQALGRKYDTLDDACAEIEELKDELATIVHTQTANGRDHWDTPQIKTSGGKTGRLRKDRYSALLMANMAARLLQRAAPEQEYKAKGGWAKSLAGAPKGGQLYLGPDWWVNGGAYRSAGYGASVRRPGQ